MTQPPPPSAKTFAKKELWRFVLAAFCSLLCLFLGILLCALPLLLFLGPDGSRVLSQHVRLLDSVKILIGLQAVFYPAYLLPKKQRSRSALISTLFLGLCAGILILGSALHSAHLLWPTLLDAFPLLLGASAAVILHRYPPLGTPSMLILPAIAFLFTLAYMVLKLQMPESDGTQLADISLISLETELNQAISLYGAPLEQSPHEDVPEATQYTFAVGDYHEAVITAWQGKIHHITYWSAQSHPKKDLQTMFRFYGQGQGWNTFTQGYSYRRKDNKLWLWCSVAPAIGVESIQFQQERQRRTQHSP